MSGSPASFCSRSGPVGSRSTSSASVRQRTPADAAWQARTRALASRLGVRSAWQPVQSEQAESPLTFGVLRPLIVLPTSALTGMPASQLEALLAHELAHIRRHDYLANLVQRAVETLLSTTRRCGRCPMRFTAPAKSAATTWP